MIADLAQLLINGLLAGALLAVPAIGFTAIYAVLRFPNFAVASHATIGAYAGYIANVTFGLPAWVALAAAFLVAGLFGVVTDELVLRRLRPASARQVRFLRGRGANATPRALRRAATGCRHCL